MPYFLVARIVQCQCMIAVVAQLIHLIRGHAVSKNRMAMLMPMGMGIRIGACDLSRKIEWLKALRRPVRVFRENRAGLQTMGMLETFATELSAGIDAAIVICRQSGTFLLSDHVHTFTEVQDGKPARRDAMQEDVRRSSSMSYFFH